jgi:hypothetical protein
MALYLSSLLTNTPSATDVNNVSIPTLWYRSEGSQGAPDYER